MEWHEGMRVGVVRMGQDGPTLVGYGTYEGQGVDEDRLAGVCQQLSEWMDAEEPPVPEGASALLDRSTAPTREQMRAWTPEQLVEHARTHPLALSARLRLDDGQVLSGRDHWWDAEEHVRRLVEWSHR